MEDMLFSDFLVLAAAGMFVLGYLIINQIILRTMLLIGTALYIWYYAVVDDAPLWPAIWASAATGSANLIGMLGLIYRRSAWAVPREFRDIYPYFDVLPPGDFRKLMKATIRVTRPAGYRLTTADTTVDTLYYIIDGTVAVEKLGSCFSIPKNSFVGEVAYLTGNPASASTFLVSETLVLEWQVQKLKRRANRDPRFRLALDAMISIDFAGKVARAGAPPPPSVRKKPS